MTEHTASGLRRLASPRRATAAGRGGRWAAVLLLRLGCVALLAWIGYIHLHLWLEGYRHIATNGPLFLLDAVAGFVLAAVLLAWPRPLAGLLAAGVHRRHPRRPAHQPQRGPVRLPGVDLSVICRRIPGHRDDHRGRPHQLDRPGGSHPRRPRCPRPAARQLRPPRPPMRPTGAGDLSRFWPYPGPLAGSPPTPGRTPTRSVPWIRVTVLSRRSSRPPVCPQGSE